MYLVLYAYVKMDVPELDRYIFFNSVSNDKFKGQK